MRVSVIIPTRNRAQRIGELLDSLSNQKPAPFEWEVIVVDNGSTDDTAAIVQEKRRQSPVPIRYALELRPGLHQGRHRGAREARGEYLAYLDDDTIVTPTWLEGVELLFAGRAEAVVGRILPQWEVDPPPWLLARMKTGVYAPLTLLDLGPRPRPVEPILVWGACFFIPRELVFRLGGFHPDGMPPELLRYRGDGETALMRQFRANGLRAWYHPGATVYHVIGPERMTVKYLCQRAYNQGISDSFTEIRSAHRAKGLAEVSSQKSISINRHNFTRTLRRVSQMSPLEVSRALLRRMKRSGRRMFVPRQSLIEERIREAYEAGWRFHRGAAASDPALMTYILRDNFLDD